MARPVCLSREAVPLGEISVGGLAGPSASGAYKRATPLWCPLSEGWGVAFFIKPMGIFHIGEQSVAMPAVDRESALWTG